MADVEMKMAAAALKLVEDKGMDKQKALETALGQIERALRQGLDHAPRRTSARWTIEAMSTGSLGLDIALGIGGLPRGRIIEIYGPECSGKTTLALHAIAEAQKSGGVGAFIDAEHALDPIYARKLGVDLDDLLISQPDTGEQALEIADTLVRSGAVDVLVIDSVAALVPRAETRGRDGRQPAGPPGAPDEPGAAQAHRLDLANRTTMVIFINQIRMKIGVMYGSPETTTGGNALKFYASVRLDIRRIGSIKDRDEVIGNQTRVKVVKNKVAPPFTRGRIRHHVWRRHLQDRRADRSRRQGRHRREVGRPGSPMTASASDRAARTPGSSCKAESRRSRTRSRRRSARMPGIIDETCSCRKSPTRTTKSRTGAARRPLPTDASCIRIGRPARRRRCSHRRLPAFGGHHAGLLVRAGVSRSGRGHAPFSRNHPHCLRLGGALYRPMVVRRAGMAGSGDPT